MPIVLVRIDDRLIHGQVVEGWLRTTRANHIVVINDIAATNDLQKALLSLATPQNIKLTILTLDQAGIRLTDGFPPGERTLILFSNPQDILVLIEQGIFFESINVGGLHQKPNKKSILPALWVDEQDNETFYDLARFGAKIDFRPLPTDDRIDLITLISQKEKKNL